VLRAILIFVLLGSTAMAKVNLERMKKLSKLSKVPLERILKFQLQESKGGTILTGDSGKSGGDLHLLKSSALLLTNPKIPIIKNRKFTGRYRKGILADQKLYNLIKKLDTKLENGSSEYSRWLVANEDLQDKLVVGLLKDTQSGVERYVKQTFNRKPTEEEYYAYWNASPKAARAAIKDGFKSKAPEAQRVQRNINIYRTNVLKKKSEVPEAPKVSKLPKVSKPPQVSKPSKDSKPFAQAFKEARAEGKREFTWRGKRYLTLEKGESMDEFEEKFKFVDDQKFDNVEEFERSKDEDMAKAQQEIIEEAKQPKQEMKPEDIKLEQTIPMDQSVPFGVFAEGQPEFDRAEEQEKDKLMMAAEGGEVNPRIPRKKGQPAKSKKHSDLYTDEDPVGTIQGLGFKDVATAKASVSKIRKSSRSHAHKVQAAVAMEQRAREMGKTSEAAVYRKFIDQMKEKTKKMAKAEGGEIGYQNGGEVFDVPEYLRRPEENIEEEDFRIEDVTQMELEDPEVQDLETRPDPFPKRERSPDFQGVREFQLSQMDTGELLDKKVAGQPREPAVTRELSRRKKEFGISLKELAGLEEEKKQREENKRKKDEAEKQRKKFEQLNKVKIQDRTQKELDEAELRKALDESIVQAEKAAQGVDPKRFFKNMSTFNKIVSLVGLAAGAYGSYKYGTPNTFVKRLDREVEKDIKAQQLGLENEGRKLAAAKFKVGQIAKKLAMSTKNEEQKIRLLQIFQRQRTAGVKELKKLQDEQQLVNVNKIVNTRGITDDELSKFDSKYRKLKLRDSMIKGRDGLNYFVRGGPSNINKVKAYLADAQDSIDGLTDLYSYFDKISIIDQAAPIFSIDAAAAQSLRDRLVGKLRIEFFGPGVMTDQERAQAKKILGDPNALLTTDAREKPKILKLIMKLNYGVRDKLRRDGVAIQKTPNDLRIEQMLSRRNLENNAKNRRFVIDALIQGEIDAQKAGKAPGSLWNMNEPLPV
tara:strand:- start:1756 stop:4698 length:2943 start_codon:yes stop_codon:yes gene_type:complete